MLPSQDSVLTTSAFKPHTNHVKHSETKMKFVAILTCFLLTKTRINKCFMFDSVENPNVFMRTELKDLVCEWVVSAFTTVE